MENALSHVTIELLFVVMTVRRIGIVHTGKRLPALKEQQQLIAGVDQVGDGEMPQGP